MKKPLIEEYAHDVSSQVSLARVEGPRHIRLPYVFILGRPEAAEAYCRARSIHPALYKPVVCWPNLTGYGTKHRYDLVLVPGWSQVDGYEKIISRARLFGFRVRHAY